MLVVILIAYMILAYFLLKNKNEYLIIGICIPFLGILLVWICDYTMNHLSKEKYIQSEIENYNFEYVQNVDLNNELNVVPMNETLSVNDYNLRRKSIMNMLQNDDLEEYLDVLHSALDNEDSETSHYATAVIIEMQNKIIDTLMMKKELYEKNITDESSIYEWNEALLKVINSGLFSEANILKYQFMYQELSNHILENQKVNENYFYERIQYDFKQKDYSHVYSLLLRYKEQYPASEDMILCFIQYYVETK